MLLSRPCSGPMCGGADRPEEPVMPIKADTPKPFPFPRLHRPDEAERADLEAAWAERPPQRPVAIRSGEVPEEDSTKPGWWPERWDGLA